MLLGLESERVDVDAHRGDVGVVLVGLHLVEVASLAHLEAVVAVQLEERRDHGVLARHALHAGHGVARLQHGAVPPVGEVERLLTLPRVHVAVVTGHIRVTLHNPDELLAGVVEVQLELVGGGGDGLHARKLQGLNQVLVGHLGELAALVRVQVEVVHIQRRRHQVRVVHTVADGVDVGLLGGDVPAQVAELVELQVHAHLVVLERNEGQRQTRVAAEPELERDVQRVLGRALAHLVRRIGLARRAEVVAVLAALHQQIRQLGHVAHHLRIAGLLARLLGELIPDVQPVAIVFVDALAANLNLHILDEVVADPVEPTELRARAVRGRIQGHTGQGRLEIHTVDQVTVALDGASHLATEARRAVEGVLNGLHRIVGVAAIHHLEEGNLGITGQVHVLSAISHKLHQTTTRHFCLYPLLRK